jgi:hypothetical protein
MWNLFGFSKWNEVKHVTSLEGSWQWKHGCNNPFCWLSDVQSVGKGTENHWNIFPALWCFKAVWHFMYVHNLYDTSVCSYQFCEMFSCSRLTLPLCAKSNSANCALPLSRVKRDGVLCVCVCVCVCMCVCVLHCETWTNICILICATRETLLSIFICFCQFLLVEWKKWLSPKRQFVSSCSNDSS